MDMVKVVARVKEVLAERGITASDAEILEALNEVKTTM